MINRTLLVALVIGLAPLQTAAQSGVLLGLDTNQGYHTLWIATDGDSVALLASGPDLLVPRADGFWRAGVIAVDEDTEAVVVGPASRWETVVDSVRRAQPPPPDDRCEPFDDVQILFLGPDYVSTRVSGGEETCGNVPNAWDSYAVIPLDATVPPVEDVLDIGTSQQLKDVLSLVRDSVRAALLSDPSWTEDLVYRCYRSSGTWGIRRKAGGWEVAGSLPPLPRWYCEGVRVPLPVSTPEVVVGSGRVFPDLAEVSLVIRDARDAVFSPGRDLVVALTGDSLYAARVADGRIQRPTLALPVRGRGIVMEEWALGRHVQRWTGEVQELLGAAPARTDVPPPAQDLSPGVEVSLIRGDGSEDLPIVLDRHEFLLGPRAIPRDLEPSGRDVLPVPQLDSVAPLHAPRSSNIALTLYGAALDSIRVSGWLPTSTGGFRRRPWLTFPVVPDPDGTRVTFIVPHALAAVAGPLLFKTNHDGGVVLPFLVTDPDLPALGTAEAEGSVSVVAWRPDQKSYGLSVWRKGDPNPPGGRSLVIGRGDTPAFALRAEDVWSSVAGRPIQGFIPEWDLGKADDLFLAVRSAGGTSLSPPISIPSPLWWLEEERPSWAPPPEPLPAACGDYREDRHGRGAAWVSHVTVIGPMTLSVVGFGLEDGVAMVFRSRTLRGAVTEEVVARLGPIEVIGPDPNRCRLYPRGWGPLRERQQARVVFTRERP